MLAVLFGLIAIYWGSANVLGQDEAPKAAQKVPLQRAAPTPQQETDKAKFQAHYDLIPPDVEVEIRRNSWRPGCPVAIADLRLVTLTYWGFDDSAHSGQLVVNKAVAREVVDIFAELFAKRFPIASMQRIDAFEGDDEASMSANNTSAFNCRKVNGGKGYSRHAYGLAIDINPLQNPYVRGETIQPAEGRAYLKRTETTKGLIVSPGPVVSAFARYGWKWGGVWRRAKDYQHFERTL